MKTVSVAILFFTCLPLPSQRSPFLCFRSCVENDTEILESYFYPFIHPSVGTYKNVAKITKLVIVKIAGIGQNKSETAPQQLQQDQKK